MKNKFLVATTMILGAVAARADIPSTHGMLVFGDKVTYASHLPMFHQPHDYQLIMKISFGYNSRKTLFDYQAYKNQGKTLFTIEPEKMDLVPVIEGKAEVFQAILYEGHFERGGTVIGPVSVKVEKVIYAQKLSQGSSQNLPDHYLAFGEKGEYFAAHVIHGKPNADYVVKIKQPETLISSQCRAEPCADQIKIPVDDSALPKTLTYQGGRDLFDVPQVGEKLGVTQVSTEVISPIYFEQDELAH